jgi:pimeloyl-ACP methyl ester carboxylesterase
MHSGHESIRGVDYYYEVHGAGESLLLLHGGLGDMRMMAPWLRRNSVRSSEIFR